MRWTITGDESLAGSLSVRRCDSTSDVQRGAKVYAAGPMTSRREFICLATASGFISAAYATGVRHTVAQTRAGKIGGVRDHGVHIFKGVPYGANTAARRFLPPAV